MPLVLDYKCTRCQKPMPKECDSMLCKCGGDYRTSQADSKGWLNYHDPNLGATITSERQRRKLMKKHKMLDGRDCPKSSNPYVQEATDKWKFRNRRGLV